MLHAALWGREAQFPEFHVVYSFNPTHTYLLLHDQRGELSQEWNNWLPWLTCLSRNITESRLITVVRTAKKQTKAIVLQIFCNMSLQWSENFVRRVSHYVEIQARFKWFIRLTYYALTKSRLRTERSGTCLARSSLQNVDPSQLEKSSGLRTNT